ncbi:MAG: hypothetical protein M1827_002879 [Pycnora praestabilis]|nr:MAG: hypothetical protein M1827_002879 [Pycnora praestabilis]
MSSLNFLKYINVLQPGLIVVAALITRFFYLRYLHPLSKYPGPFLASQTELWRLWSYYQGSHHLVDQKLHHTYGPIVRDGPNSLLFCKPEDSKVIWSSRKFEKGDFYLLQGEPTYDLNRQHIFQVRSDGEHRQRRKRLAITGFSAKSIATYEQSISRNIALWIEQVENERTFKGDAVDLAVSIRYLTLDIVSEVSYGETLGFLDAWSDVRGILKEKETNKSTQAGIPIVFGASLVSWIARLLAWKPLNSFMRKPQYDADGQVCGFGALFQYTRDIFERAASGKADALPPSVMKNFLLPPTGIERFNDNEAKRELVGLLVAGTGSIAAALSVVLNNIAKHGEWQQRVFSQVSSLTSRHPDRPCSELMKLSDLKAVIKESLRLAPPFPSVFERIVTKGAENEIPGLPYPVPAGTRVWSNIYVVGRSQSVFGDDANQFRPERWLTDDQDRLRQMEENWVIFGRGPRMCIARDIAMNAIYKFLAEVCLHLSLDLPPILSLDPSSFSPPSTTDPNNQTKVVTKWKITSFCLDNDKDNGIKDQGAYPKGLNRFEYMVEELDIGLTLR